MECAGLVNLQFAVLEKANTRRTFTIPVA